MLMVALKRGDLRTILGFQACQKNGVRESLPVSAAFRGVQECSSKAAGSKEEPSSPYKAFKLVSPKDGFDTQEEEALPPLTRPLKSQLQQLWKIRPLRQRQLDLHPDQMQQVKARTPRTLAWTAACFPRWPGPTRILLATGRQDFLGTTRWFSSPCLFSPFAFLFPFLLPLPCHSSAGVWVRATDRELEGRSWEKNCPPSRSYRRGSWEAAESRSSSNKWLLREEVAERRGVSPQQRKVARPCSPIHPFIIIHPFIHSFANSFGWSLVHWLIYYSLVHCFNDSFSLIHWFNGRFTDSLLHWFVDSLVYWSIDSLINDSLVHWFIGSLLHCFIAPLVHWFIDPLIDSMFDSLIYSLVHWFIQSAVCGFFHVISLASQQPCAHSLVQHFVASASQKLSYRPSSSYSFSFFSKLPPRRVPGTTDITYKQGRVIITVPLLLRALNVVHA